MSLTNYVPRVLLCGNMEKFRREFNDRPIAIVGRIRFVGAAEHGEFVMPAHKKAADSFKLDGDFKISLDDAELSVDTLKKILDGYANYIVIDKSRRISGSFPRNLRAETHRPRYHRSDAEKLRSQRFFFA